MAKSSSKSRAPKQAKNETAPNVDGRSNREIIISELERLPGWKRPASDGWFMVCCPFHDEGTPSCGVRIAEPALGVYNCLGCGEKGGWNKLAKRAGLLEVKLWNTAESVDTDTLLTVQTDEELLGQGSGTFAAVIKSFNAPEAALWPERIEWRGFPGWFMRKLGAHIIMDYRAESVAAILPIKVAGKVHGGVKAAFVKDPNNKNALSYISSKGHWVQDYGLFPYVYTKKLLRDDDLDFVVLVEGPRDAMRLCLNGIPALAVLGANNITAKKILYVRMLGVNTIYVMSDPDNAGTKMWKLVKSLCSPNDVEAKRVKLPETHDDGRKLDPGNMPRTLMRRFMNVLTDKHGFTQPKRIH